MSGAAGLQQEYRRSVERAFQGGHTGACTDAVLRDALRRRLLEEPELHGVLRSDAFAVLASGLWGQPSLLPALRGLAAAFQVLELAALNLHFFPWRKEFSTIKTFSGVYVHCLRAALPEPDLARSFRRLGYERRDAHHLVVTRPPPGAELMHVACSFFAARLECEILEDVLLQLGPCCVSADDLLQARRGTSGLSACVERLQRLARWPRGRELGVAPAPGGEADTDLYQDPGNLSRTPVAGRRSYERSPKLWGEPAGGYYPLPEAEDPELEQGLGDRADPELASFSFLSLRQELGRVGGSLTPENARSRSPAPSCSYSPRAGASSPGLYRAADRPFQAAENAWGLAPACPRPEGGEGAGPVLALSEVPRYQLHMCLSQGTLPSYYCSTCQQLHARGCEALQACWGGHSMQELRGEKQQRLWLLRTEVDMMLQESGGGRP
ncbi:spermatogenesis-associated protein 2-like protein [Alligator mississippiensis]|uniref:spermatogenesis-associated protein 2-like protein n=1 Tax=Alligator mississippiensis TaxID=8496 RepID=UPI002877B174|nr:spermatogenesis-associated protein 2-like protein [Alligator mississippiensis]